MKCSDESSAKCEAGCLCPGGTYFQEGKCKKLATCKCVWAPGIFGARPKGAKEYYDPQEVVNKDKCTD